MRLQLQLWIAACVVLIVPSIASAQATEFIANEGPVPESVEELDGPIVIAFPGAEELPVGLWGSANKWLGNRFPFWSDLSLGGNFRSYYFLRDNGTTALIEENKAWAAGGTLNFESGKFWKLISVGGEYFASVPIDASDNTPGSGLLQPIQNTISTFGQAYVRATLGEQVVTFGRQRINKPYVNANDSRMLPITFQGITLDA